MKIDILRPRYRYFPPDADEAFGDMARAAMAAGHDLHIPKLRGNAMVHSVRNKAIARLRRDADYVLFCDDDMAPAPDDLLRLVAHGLPVVSALCTTREIPPRYAAKAYNAGTGDFAVIEDFKPDTVAKGPFGVGAAFVLLQRAVIDQVVEYYLSGRDWLEENRRLFDRLHVRAEWRERERVRREGLRRETFARDGTVRVFRFSDTDTDQENGEDIHFSRLLLQLGVPVAIDTGCIVAHIGDFPYSAHLMGMGHWKEVRMV